MDAPKPCSTSRSTYKATPTKKSPESTGRLIAIVVLTLVPFAAAAQSTGVLATKRPITWGMIFALLFLMLGPIKLLGPFAAATKDSTRIFRFRLATPRLPIRGCCRHHRRAWPANARQLCHSGIGVANRRGPNPFPRRTAGSHASIRRNPAARSH